ncbi:tetratricopeptide repeat protein, partial [Marinilabilia sp.]
SLIKVDSTNTFFLNKIAEVYQELSNTDSALICYTKSAEISPKSLTIYKAGKLFLGKERAEEALEFFGKYYHPGIHKSKPLRRLIGQAYYLTDSIKKSIAVFSELYENGDSSFITTKFLGMSSRKAGQYIKGEEVLRIAAFQNPNDFLVYFNLGICCRKIGLVDESEKHFNTAMEIVSTPLMVKNMINTELAETFEKQMRWKKALALYQDILKSDPSNLSIRMKALFVLDYQIKDRKQALNEYKTTLKMFEEDTTNSDHYNKQVKNYLKRRINKIEKEEFWHGGES